MGVAPIVVAFGLIALIIAEYPPFFQWLGAPFVPLLELMQIPFPKKADTSSYRFCRHVPACHYQFGH